MAGYSFRVTKQTRHFSMKRISKRHLVESIFRKLVVFEKETWLDVLGYEGYYEVSDLGRVRSTTRSVKIHSNYKRVRIGKILKPTIYYSRAGHLYVDLSCKGKRKKFQIHRLVLEAFVGPCPIDMEACHHPDSTPSNNRLTNLRWDTHLNNEYDKFSQGSYTRKLSLQDRLDIYKLWKVNKWSQKKIAQKYGLHCSMVSLLVRVKIHKYFKVDY